MKQSKKTLSVLIMLMMVVTTLAPTWAFGTESTGDDNGVSVQQETTAEGSTGTQQSPDATKSQPAQQTQKSSVAQSDVAQKEQTSEVVAEHFAEITAEGIGTGKTEDVPYLEAGIVKLQKDKTVSVKKDKLDKTDQKTYRAKQNLNDTKEIGYSDGNAYGITLKNYYDAKGSARDAYQLDYIDLNGYKIKIADVEAAKDQDFQVAHGKISGFDGDADVFVDPENGRDLTVAFSGDVEFSKDLKVSFEFADSAKTTADASAKSDAAADSEDKAQAAKADAVSDEVKTKAAAMALTQAANTITARMSSDAEAKHENQVRVIIENTTLTKDAGAAWDGTLVDTWVDLDESSTMMSCIVAALDSINARCDGADSGYITSINGLGAGTGATFAGWMGTLNDWFTSNGFSACSVAEGNLKAGDEIRVMYSLNMGEDIGGSWSNNDKTVKSIVTNAGKFSPVFDKDTHEYTLTVPKGTKNITVTPIASNKNFQVRTYVGTTEYGRNDQIPVSDGTNITVKCGDPSWPSMNSAEEVPAEEYSITIKEKAEQTVQAKVTTSFQEGNSYLMTPHSLTVESDLAESYGYTDTVDSTKSVSALDVLVRMHEEMFGSDFSKDTKDAYLAVSDSGWITLLAGENGSTSSFAINEAYPYDPNSEYGSYGYTGYTINQASVADGDSMDVFFYQDSYYMDYYTWFEQNGAKVKKIEAKQGESIALNLQGLMYAFCGSLTKEDAIKQGGLKGIEDAQLTLVNAETGAATDLSNAVTDEDGNVSISFDKPGTYYVSAYGDEYTPITSPWLKVTVTSAAPVLKDGVDKTVAASVEKGASYTLDLNTIFQDPLNKDLTYTVSVDGAKEEAIDSKYSISFDTEGTHKLVFRASNGTQDSEETYTVNLTIEKAKAKLSSLLIHNDRSPSDKTVLMKNQGDAYSSGITFDPSTYEYTLSAQTDEFDKLGFRVKAADADSTVTIYYGDGKSDKLSSSSVSKMIQCLEAGKNTFSIKVDPKAGSDQEAATYIFTIDCMPTLTGITAKSGSTELYLDKAFAAGISDYTLTIPESAESIDFDATSRQEGYTVLYDGKSSSSVSVKGKDQVQITVTGGPEKKSTENTYTLQLKRAKQLDFRINVTPKDAIIKVYDGEGNEVEANETGSFSGMFAESNYTYVVTKYGYVAQTGTVPKNGGQLTINLEKAADSGLEDVSADWGNFRGSDTNMGITDAMTPISKDDTTLLWNAKLSSGWSDAPSVQIIVDDSLIVMAGKKIYKLNLKTGETLKTGEMAAAPSYGYTPPIYAEGMIFTPLGDGTIQAFNAKTLESLWIYKDSMGGQSLSPLTYSNGYIYTGFWNRETGDAHYVCLSVTDEDVTKSDEAKHATWVHKQKGGYYWAGSVAIGNYIIVGSDDGDASGTNGDSVLTVYNQETGKVISQLELTGAGDQRSSIAYDKESDRLYFTTKGGYLCSAKVDKKSGKISGLKKVNYNAQSTSTPIVYKGRVYFGVGSGFGSNPNQNFVAADAETLQPIFKVNLKGYPQCSPLLSTAYESEGYLYFYMTYNNNPGGISMIKVKNDPKSQSDAELIELYDAEGFQNYCISSIICDKNGTLYYKNDSGNIFAVGLPDYKTVRNLIDRIDEVTLDSKTAVDTARKAYDALSEENKAKVTNYDKLVAAEKKLSKLQIEHVEKLIDAIGTVTLDKEDKIKEAKEAYDALTDSQKKQVSNYDVLKKAIEKLEQLKKAAANKETLNGIAPSGSSLTASGTTRSITKKATIKLGKMTEAAKAALDKLDAVVNGKLPQNAKEYTDDQIKQILDAYKAYNALSVSEKKAIEATDTWTAFTEITQNLGSMYHYDEATGIDVRATSAKNLPWYIKLVVTPKTASEKQKTKVQDALGDNSELFTLYDIHFINTLDNSEWHPSGLIRVKMPMVSIGNYKTPVIVHIADSGKIRLIEGHVDSAGGTIEFEASDFSLYGIAGSDQSIDSLLGAQAARDVMPWIIAGAIAAAILIAIIVMRKRRNKRGFYE